MILWMERSLNKQAQPSCLELGYGTDWRKEAADTPNEGYCQLLVKQMVRFWFHSNTMGNLANHFTVAIHGEFRCKKKNCELGLLGQMNNQCKHRVGTLIFSCWYESEWELAKVFLVIILKGGGHGSLSECFYAICPNLI